MNSPGATSLVRFPSQINPLFRIRDYTPADFGRIKQIFDQRGFRYELPRLDTDPLFTSKLVLTDENDSVQMGVALRLEANAYAFVDESWSTPQNRWAALQQIHDAAKAESSTKGLDTVTAQIPPEIEKSFSKRLNGLGWNRLLWNTYVTRF
jgi:hypothetical protein